MKDGQSLFQKLALALALITMCPLPSANAGPLLDWLFGRRNQLPAYPVGPPVPLGSNVAGYAPYGYSGVAAPYSATYGAYAARYPAQYSAGFSGSATGLGCSGSALPGGTAVPGTVPTAPTVPGTTVPPPGLPPTASYVPNFNSFAARTPVTYYRPIVTTDPATGAQRVVMAPCSSYEYQTRRVPAFGRRSLFGSLFGLPPRQQPLPQAQPTYTIPSGGIPVAVVPMIPPAYMTAYGPYPALAGGTVAPYAALQPAPALTPAAPLGGTTSPACGAVPASPTVPGLVAPPAGGASFPGTVPVPSPGIYPPSSSPSSDPAADIPPSLPSDTSASASGDRLRRVDRPEVANRSSQSLRSVVNQPRSSDSGGQPTPFSGDGASGNRDLPVLRPIPAPEGYQPQRRWNPGLLSEDDLTARWDASSTAPPVTSDSKPIHWASFQSASPTLRSMDGTAAARGSAVASDRDSPEAELQLEHRLRPITPPRDGPPRDGAAGARSDVGTVSSPASDSVNGAVPRSYATSGWRAAR